MLCNKLCPDTTGGAICTEACAQMKRQFAQLSGVLDVRQNIHASTYLCRLKCLENTSITEANDRGLCHVRPKPCLLMCEQFGRLLKNTLL